MKTMELAYRLAALAERQLEETGVVLIGEMEGREGRYPVFMGRDGSFLVPDRRDAYARA